MLLARRLSILLILQAFDPSSDLSAQHPFGQADALISMPSLRGWPHTVNLGIQTAFASNVAAGSASSAPGRGPTGEPGAETFSSTYVLSASKSSANSVRLPENGLTRVKSNAKAAAGASGLTASPNSAPKEETLPATHATGGAPIIITAATSSLSSPTALATLPDLSQASSVEQGDLVAEEGGPSLPRTSASQFLTPQSLTPEPSAQLVSAPQSSTAHQSVTATPLSGTQSDGDLTPTQSSSPGLNPAFAEPGQVGLDPEVVAATTPVPETASANPQNSAATTSPPSSMVAPSPAQDADAAPPSSTSLNVVLGNAIPGSGATPAPVPSAANPQSRRESLAGAQRVTSGEVSDVRTPLASGTVGPTVGLTAPHGLESASSKPQNGVTAESLFQLHPSSASTSALSSSSSSSPSSASSVPPVLAGIPAAAGAGPDSSGKPTAASAELYPSPGNIHPASGTQGKDSESSDSAAGQPPSGQSGAEQSGVDQSGDAQSFRKDLTAVSTPATGPQPILPQMVATATPGDTPALPGTSPAASPAPKQENAAAPAAPDSSSSGPLAATGESPLAPAVGPVQMAQMVSRAAQSEMRIGLTTSAFGNVEVRAQIRAYDVGLAIGSERGDLRSLLANELPGVANRLQEQSLRLSQVNFHETSAFSGGSSSGGNPQRRFFTQAAPVSSPVTETTPETLPATGTTSSSSSRHAGLSVLA